VGDAGLPAIVFLHGFLGAGSDWLPFAKQLSAQYHCILVDLPGHAEATFPETLTPEQYQEGYFMHTVDALAAELQRTLSAPGFLVGYSMGGRIGLALALRYPELFGNAVIISSSPGLQTEEERALRRKSDEGMARKIEKNFDGFIEFWYSQPLFSTLKSHPLFEEVEASRKQGSPHSLAMALRLLGTGNQPPLHQKLASNRMPMLFMTGEKDLKFVEIARQMVTLSSYFSQEIFPGCGHTLHTEKQQRFIDRLQDFFNTQEEPA
jgi:2-succinyl-6-hydroxy-2,4-cyclohexadiene-1-carboxylate synthase